MACQKGPHDTHQVCLRQRGLVHCTLLVHCMVCVCVCGGGGGLLVKCTNPQVGDSVESFAPSEL